MSRKQIQFLKGLRLQPCDPWEVVPEDIGHIISPSAILETKLRHWGGRCRVDPSSLPLQKPPVLWYNWHQSSYTCRDKRISRMVRDWEMAWIQSNMSYPTCPKLGKDVDQFRNRSRSLQLTFFLMARKYHCFLKLQNIHHTRTWRKTKY